MRSLRPAVAESQNPTSPIATCTYLRPSSSPQPIPGTFVWSLPSHLALRNGRYVAMAKPVKQSASKEEFLRALGLNPSIPEDKLRLDQMWEEVTIFWTRNFETTSRQILKPEYASNAQVQRPYKWAHLSPGVIDNAIQQIWHGAKPAPRHYYDLGYSEDHKVYNWVLKWLLWHVCRYRDWRNRKAKGNGPNGAPTAVAITVSSPESNAFPRHDYWATVMN